MKVVVTKNSCKILKQCDQTKRFQIPPYGFSPVVPIISTSTRTNITIKYPCMDTVLSL